MRIVSRLESLRYVIDVATQLTVGMPFPFDALWILSSDGKTASCEIRFVPIGVEARILIDGRLLYARTFPTGDQTLEWAEGERQKMLSNGWELPTIMAE